MRRQLAQLKADNDALSSRMTRLSRARTQGSTPAPDAIGSVGMGSGTNAPFNMQELVDNPPTTTTAQLQGYLKAHGRDATSLLAAYEVTHDRALLAEAMQKYPSDRKVDFEAAINPDLPSEERRQWLSAFEKSAPDNALANYLSALDYFKAGQSGQALQEIVTASGKQGFQ